MTAPGANYPVQCAAPYIGTPVGYQQLTSFASATGLTVPATATFAMISVEGTVGTDTVRWRDDGINPTSSIGMLMNGSGSSSWPPFLYSGDLSAIKFIVAAGSAKLNVSYYR
jgi:hypothetical protein